MSEDTYSPETGEVPVQGNMAANGVTIFPSVEQRRAELRELREFREMRRLKSLGATAPVPAPVEARPAVDPAVVADREKALANRQQTMEAQKRRQARKFRRILFSALIFIGLPTLASTIYFGWMASNQYEATGQFAIRSNNPGNSTAASSGLASILSGSGAGSLGAMDDTYIIQEYIESGQMLDDIKPYVNVREVYSKPGVDSWARLDPKTSDEQLLNYWQSMVRVDVDNTTGLARLSVRAFTPEEAKSVADHILSLSEALVNKLSERAQGDTIAVAQKGVDEAYDRVVRSLDAIENFAVTTQQISPSAMVQAHTDVQNQLNADFISSKTQLDLLRKDLPDDAPGVLQLKNRISVLGIQLAQDKANAIKTAAAGGDSAPLILKNFDKLTLERDFAEKAYTSALDTLEAARLEAMTKTRYLEAFVRPRVANEAMYPKRVQDVLLTFLVTGLIWILGSLLVAAAKEHL